MKTKNKILPILLIFSMIISLIGCGSTANPVAGENVVESTETTVESSTKTTVEPSDGTTTETGGKGDAVVDADKPVETPKPSATGKPESTAEPTASPTEKPQTTATPEPTAPPHVHEYMEAVTKQPTCAEAGVKTLTCACGDVKTEAIPATGQHNWDEITNLVHHASIGHEEEVEQQVQVGTTEVRHEYECAYCGHREDSPDALKIHCDSYVDEGNIDHVFARTLIWDYPGEPIYEIQTQSVWVVDQEAYDSVEIVGYKCSICGATK